MRFCPNNNLGTNPSDEIHKIDLIPLAWADHCVPCSELPASTCKKTKIVAVLSLCHSSFGPFSQHQFSWTGDSQLHFCHLQQVIFNQLYGQAYSCELISSDTEAGVI